MARKKKGRMKKVKKGAMERPKVMLAPSAGGGFGSIFCHGRVCGMNITQRALKKKYD